MPTGVSGGTENWFTLGWIMFLVLALGYYVYQSARDSHRSTEGGGDPLKYITLIREDVPRYSFVELYRRFPFDCTDIKYLQIKELEQEYSQATNEFLDFHQHKSPKMFVPIGRIEDCLESLYDIMMQYMNKESDVFRKFELYSGDVFDWFDDLRREHQADLKQFTGTC